VPCMQAFCIRNKFVCIFIGILTDGHISWMHKSVKQGDVLYCIQTSLAGLQNMSFSSLSKLSRVPGCSKFSRFVGLCICSQRASLYLKLKPTRLFARRLNANQLHTSRGKQSVVAGW
jgi:hypothetical protein